MAITQASGLLSSWATPAASVPIDAMRSEISSCSSIFLRSARIATSRSSRSIAGTSRSSRPLAMKSCAPAWIAATAMSSPTVPETMMNGRSRPCSLTCCSASGALNRGIE